MKKIKLILSIFVLLSAHNFKANSEEIILSFSASHDGSWAQLDSVVIENITQSARTTLFYPDTVMSLPTGTNIINPQGHNNLYVSQNYPNPFSKKTNINIGVIETDNFIINVYDITGRLLTSYKAELEPNVHSFTFYACSEQTYILTVKSNKHIEKQLMIQVGQGGGYSKILYNGSTVSMESGNQGSKSEFTFNLGDNLRFTGYVGMMSEEKLDSPTEDTDYVFDGLSCKPDAPTATNATDVNHFSFTANWNEITFYPSVTHYLIDVSEDSDFSTYILEQEDVGDVTEYQISDLDSETRYYYRLFAVNACETSDASNVISVETTEHPCGDEQEVTFIYNGEEVVYRTVGTASGQCWMDRNLGAISYDESDPLTHGPAAPGYRRYYGDLFQWGRGADGHQVITWTSISSTDGEEANRTTEELSLTDSPGHSDFIINTDSPGDWLDGQNDNLWQKDDGLVLNNPCPEGWRVPTISELETEIDGLSNISEAFHTDLAFVLGGFREASGDVVLGGSHGRYWSSSVSGTNSERVNFSTSSIFIAADARAIGSLVRCIKDPEVICAKPDTPTATSADDIEDVLFTANWDEVTPDPDVAYYLLDVSTDNDFSSFLPGYKQKNVGNTSGYQVVDLDSETEYYYRVFAINVCGNISDASNVISVETLCSNPDAPIANAVTELEHNWFTANWDAVISDPVVIRYLLDVSEDSDFSTYILEKQEVVGITEYVVDDLDFGTEYYYRVFAESTCGISDASNVISVETLCLLPDAPTATVATDIEDHSFTANWSAVTSVPAVTHYLVDVSEDSDFSSYILEKENVGNVTEYIVEDLDFGIEYHYRVFAVNPCGSSDASNTISVETVPETFICGGFFIDDRDANIYNTVQIDDQCWMAQNLAYLPEVHNNDDHNAEGLLERPAYGVYGYDGGNVGEAKAFEIEIDGSLVNTYETYGVLYNWWAAMDEEEADGCNGSGGVPNDACITPIQGICPEGWHLPSHNEWTTLERFICEDAENDDCESEFLYDEAQIGWQGTDEGDRLKCSDEDNFCNSVCNNVYEFSALASGFRVPNGSFDNADSLTNWWSTTNTAMNAIWYRGVKYDQSEIRRNVIGANYGLPVRCIKD